jgi:Cytidine and deoxycytidylate deaminase zinc-binding region
MRMAIEEARLADFPFGSVIVRDGAVMARGRNLGRTNQDPTAHGEMNAIRKCLAEHGPATLRGSTLYTSGEPCVMCMGAIPLVPRRAAGVCRVGDTARDQDQSDHAVERRGRGQGAICPNLDHRRRAGRRGDGVVQVAKIHHRHPRREGSARTAAPTPHGPPNGRGIVDPAGILVGQDVRAHRRTIRGSWPSRAPSVCSSPFFAGTIPSPELLRRGSWRSSATSMCFYICTGVAPVNRDSLAHIEDRQDARHRHWYGSARTDGAATPFRRRCR